MTEKIKFILDDKVCTATPGQTIMEAALENGIYIPSLCYVEGMKPAGSCRVIEVLFVAGNHFCPACEKSGNCELQALAYRYQMMVPRFPYEFPERGVDARSKYIYHDRNRCIMCKRCIRSVMKDGKPVFAFISRGGHHLHVEMDPELANQLTEKEALEAMEICPVGAILKKERGYYMPIGTRKYDAAPIGLDKDK
jgi:[NiFe] hydrogenase diaphorase moiety small subunit